MRGVETMMDLLMIIIRWLAGLLPGGDVVRPQGVAADSGPGGLRSAPGRMLPDKFPGRRLDDDAA